MRQRTNWRDARIDLARGGRHRRIELQYRFGRLFLVPQGDREHAAGRQRAHIGLHRLLSVGKLLDDREAARIGETDQIRKAQVDDVEALIGVGEEMASLVVDDAHLGQNVAGEVADDVASKRIEDRPIALRDRDVASARMQRNFGRDAAAELGDEGLGRRLDDVGIHHRQEAEIGRLLVGQVAHDADRAVAVDIKAEIGVDRHGRQVEARVVREAGREVQIGARIGLEIAEGRRAFVDPLRVREFPRVGNALVVVDRERLQAESGRERKMASKGQCAGERIRNERNAASGARAPRRDRPQATVPGAPRSGWPGRTHTSPEERRDRTIPPPRGRRNRRGQTSGCS